LRILKKHFVSLLETHCFKAWNTLFQPMKLILELLVSFFSYRYYKSGVYISAKWANLKWQ